jgi:hypothetical protein
MGVRPAHPCGIATLLVAALAGALFALALPACDPRSAQVTAAHALAVTGQRLSPTLRAVEQAQGLALIDAGAAAGLDEPAIRVQLDALELKWAKAWAAIATMREALDAWVTAIEAESTGDWDALRDSACAVLREARQLAPDVLVDMDGLLKGVCL